jgi:hypothetical protein
MHCLAVMCVESGGAITVVNIFTACDSRIRNTGRRRAVIPNEAVTTYAAGCPKSAARFFSNEDASWSTKDWRQTE